jgi:hypothetical protein
MKANGSEGMIGSPGSIEVWKESIGEKGIVEVGTIIASSCKEGSGDNQNCTSAVANFERVRPGRVMYADQSLRVVAESLVPFQAEGMRSPLLLNPGQCSPQVRKYCVGQLTAKCGPLQNRHAFGGAGDSPKSSPTTSLSKGRPIQGRRLEKDC